MVTTVTKPAIELGDDPTRVPLPSWPSERSAFDPIHAGDNSFHQHRELRPSGGDALQALLAFSAMHQQVRRRRALAFQHNGFETLARPREFEAEEQFVLDEVLQLVAERAIAITGADGLGIALAENNEIVLRASAGVMKPDVGARIQRDSAFSGACFRTAQIIRCDDTETDDRVNLYACRQLGARSMVAVPLCGRRRVIGLLEAFSSEPFGFNDTDIGSLELLAELILGALKPEDEDRFAESAQVAETQLAAPAIAPAAPLPAAPPKIEQPSAEKLVTVAKPLLPVQDELPIEPAKKAAPVALPALTTKTELNRKNLDPVPGPEPLGHHPGAVVVLVLVVIFALLAGGLWWKLKNGQIGDALVSPAPTAPQRTSMSKQPVASVTPSSTAPSSPSQSLPSNAVVDGQNSPTNSDASADLTSPATPVDGNTTPKELSRMPRITGIRHWSSADSSTVVLDLEDQVQYEAHRLSGPDRIYFDLHDTSLPSEIEGKIIDVGDSLLARVRVAQPVSGLTRVVLETRGNSNYSVSLEPNPYRLVVQVRKLGADANTQVNLFPGAAPGDQKKLAIVVPPPTREDLQLRAHVPKMRIVVDAGHGGWDLGTVGRRGLLEKDLVLEIAQRLGKLLQSRLGAEVILTRNDDNYIPLDERAGMANQAQADLFVSVHANYSDLPSARGVETYYTNLFSSPNAKDLETRQGGGKDDRGKSSGPAMLSPAELHDKIELSRRLAASVQRSLYGTLSGENPGLRDRGVKAASYVVLTETAMPGILAEVSFVSSPTDEQKLRSEGYREQIAEALYRGIARYAAGSRGVKMASR
jgi:N-acetylmuramoyl-L-alanine amidase/putative methionine-R-sulfoxide reductase with GAF domain